MYFTDLQHYMAAISSCNQLTRISVETNPLLEIAAITHRVCKQRGGGQALLFEQPAGSAFPVATNLFGSLHRTALALGVEHLEQLTSKMTALLDLIPAIKFSGLDQQISGLPDFARFSPVSAPATWNIVMKQPDLTLFPFLQSWPDDGSASGNPRYITLPQIFTANPDGSVPNCGMYRAQVVGARELAIRWSAGSGASRHLEKFRHQGNAMPVAIALGGPPAALFSAMFSLPGDLDEMTFAGFLRGEAIEMADCHSSPLRVPATAEVVIEGCVDPAETCMEGPFGNHTGSYSPAGPAALMRVTAISHRPDAIVPATLVGPPPMEDCWMARAWEQILLAFLKKLVPAVDDIHVPMEWIFHQSAIISLEHPQPGMVREITDKLRDLPWFAASRLLIFVDAANGIKPSQVAWHAINLADFSADLIRDESSKRLALDATGCRGLQRKIIQDEDVMQRVLKRWHEYGVPLK